MNWFLSDISLPAWTLVAAGLAAAALGVVICRLLSRQRKLANSESALLEDLERSKAKDEALRESEELYRHLYESAPVGIIRTAVDGSQVMVANDAAARMFGYTSVANFKTDCRPVDAYVNPAEREAFIKALRESGSVSGHEVLIRRPDGGLKYLSISAHIHEEEGHLEGAMLDVTARKRAERELTDSHLFLQTVMDTLPNPLFYKDATGVIRHVNSAFLDFCGVKRVEVVGNAADCVFPTEVVKDWDERSVALLEGKGETVHRFNAWLRTRGGGRREVMVQEGLVLDTSGKRLGVVGVLTDVTEMKRIETDLREAWATYRNIFDNAVDGIFTSTAEGRFVRVNEGMATMLGYDSADDLMKNVTDIGSQVFADPDKRIELLKRLQDEQVVPRQESEFLRKDGSTIWVAFSLRGVFDDDGVLTRVEGLGSDISAQKLAEQELARLALTDSLTGLPNRAAFERESERMLAQARRSGQKVGVLFMDLDGFKAVNDTHGHQKGDELLKMMAERLSRRSRGSDVAARIGGDEFGVLLWDVTSPEAMESLAREIIASLSAPIDLAVCECGVGVSVGGSLYPDHGESPADLIRRADQAMYKVKQTGRNNYLLAEAGDESEAVAEAAPEAEPELFVSTEPIEAPVEEVQEASAPEQEPEEQRSPSQASLLDGE